MSEGRGGGVRGNAKKKTGAAAAPRQEPELFWSKARARPHMTHTRTTRTTRRAGRPWAGWSGRAGGAAVRPQEGQAWGMVVVVFFFFFEGSGRRRRRECARSHPRPRRPRPPLFHSPPPSTLAQPSFPHAPPPPSQDSSCRPASLSSAPNQRAPARRPRYVLPPPFFLSPTHAGPGPARARAARRPPALRPPAAPSSHRRPTSPRPPPRCRPMPVHAASRGVTGRFAGVRSGSQRAASHGKRKPLGPALAYFFSCIALSPPTVVTHRDHLRFRAHTHLLDLMHSLQVRE